METSTGITINEDWIRKKLNITHDNLEDIKSLSLAGTYQEKISHLGNALHKFTRLKELDLSRNSLVSLEGLENCKNLEKLNLYYNNIFTLKEVERLKHNDMLNELDLRLNPITKEENDYRLYLIQLLPSLKMCDDRAIRDSERQMACTYFEQTHGKSQGQASYNDQEYQSNSNSAVLSRVKSVSNIAKRSAGIHEDVAGNDNYGQYANNNHHNHNPYESAELAVDNYDKEGNNFYRSKSMQNLGGQTGGSGGATLQRQKSVHFNDVATYQDINGRSNSVDQNLNHEESDEYLSFKARSSFTPNPMYDVQQDDAQYGCPKKQTRGNEYESNCQQNGNPEEFKSTLFMLLDLVDKYWNGSKSLHQNYKFLGSANQLLKQYYPSSANGANSDTEMMFRLKQLQDENKSLQHQLKNQHKYGEPSASELQYKNYAQEIDILKKKLSNALEDNKRIHAELSNKSEKLAKEHNLEAIENQNGNMKRENEIMRIKLKQYEQLQALTAMLQESHKSLVTTNDHLLQEINFHKREIKSVQAQSRYMNTGSMGNGLSDADLYSPTASTQETSYGLPANGNGGSPAKRELRKQYEQLNNSLTNRYGFPKC